MSPIALDLPKASKALSLTRAQFLALVDEGILPRPRKLGPFELWDAEELAATIRGDKVHGYEDVSW